ncbi:hypothetical protein BST97_15210 [Nonlabens spongiae]|uniref:YdhG-like domain-containing protein n=1 Tax=Nonlabens spongiae TaxID=331648 RepID=A0A1W6MNN9_9FLAO|nr:DUF1801 domain-containing protein [Nonlabens spongiae]ARN79224.1 hypothetical protein BST97_15210 [Nonlabens spongiae]
MHEALQYIEDLPEPFVQVARELHLMIMERSDSMKLEFKWSLPFYKLDGKMFCFINFRKDYLDLGLMNGIHLEDSFGKLVDGENRKRLRSLRFTDLEDIANNRTEFYLEQATGFQS